MQGIDALILPGGESSTQLQFLQEEKLDKAITDFAHNGGAILRHLRRSNSFGARSSRPGAEIARNSLDIAIERNAYGRQLASHVTQEPSKLSDRPLEMVFIRAPIIEKLGSKVEVLAEVRRPSRSRSTGAHSRRNISSGVDFRLHYPRISSSRGPQRKINTENNLNPAKRYRVLFVCLGNSCRSPMAEAIARQTASDVIVAASAGTMALGFVAPPTLRVLEERGINVEGLSSKPITRETRSNAEIIINMTGAPRIAFSPRKNRKRKTGSSPIHMANASKPIAIHATKSKRA